MRLVRELFIKEAEMPQEDVRKFCEREAKKCLPYQYRNRVTINVRVIPPELNPDPEMAENGITYASVEVLGL